MPLTPPVDDRHPGARLQADIDLAGFQHHLHRRQSALCERRCRPHQACQGKKGGHPMGGRDGLHVSFAPAANISGTGTAAHLRRSIFRIWTVAPEFSRAK